MQHKGTARGIFPNHAEALRITGGLRKVPHEIQQVLVDAYDKSRGRRHRALERLIIVGIFPYHLEGPLGLINWAGLCSAAIFAPQSAGVHASSFTRRRTCLS